MPTEISILVKAILPYFNRFQHGLELEFTIITMIINIRADDVYGELVLSQTCIIT